MTGRVPLRFGVLSTTVHRADHDPAIQLAQEIRLAELADRLGLHEMWWGRRRAASWTLAADPLLLVARAAATTHRIRLGAGVWPVVHHHPQLLLESAIQLDHATRGRVMLGIGTGAPSADLAVLGFDPADAVSAVAQTLHTVDRLLRDEVLDLAPYAGALDIRVAASHTPEGPAIAGWYGHGLLSTVWHERGGAQSLARTWQEADQAAAGHGRTLDASRWSVAVPMHLAASEIEARRQVRRGLARHLADVGDLLPGALPATTDPDALVDALHAGGHAVVGTPDMAVEHVERLLEVGGGFGTFLLEHAGWAGEEATRASVELFAREVTPQVGGAARARVAAYTRTQERRKTASVPAPPGRAVHELRPQTASAAPARVARRARTDRPVDHVPTPRAGVPRVDAIGFDGAGLDDSGLDDDDRAGVRDRTGSTLPRSADAAVAHALTPERGISRAPHDGGHQDGPVAHHPWLTGPAPPDRADGPVRRGRHARDDTAP